MAGLAARRDAAPVRCLGQARRTERAAGPLRQPVRRPGGQMHWLAGQLGIAVPQEAWPALVRAATFESMRDSADTLVPTAGILKSNTAFFRRGTSGAGREILSGDELAAYYARAAQLAPPDMLTWLHSSHQSP